MKFVEHQHGDGPVHYAQEGGEFVFELYPAGEAGPDCAGVGVQVDELDVIAARWLTPVSSRVRSMSAHGNNVRCPRLRRPTCGGAGARVMSFVTALDGGCFSDELTLGAVL